LIRWFGGTFPFYSGIASAVKTPAMGVKVFVRRWDIQDALKRLRKKLAVEKLWPGQFPRWYKKEKLGRYLKPSHRRRRRWLVDQAVKRGVPFDMQGRIPKRMSKRKSWPQQWKF
jgi:hypothetical protein